MKRHIARKEFLKLKIKGLSYTECKLELEKRFSKIYSLILADFNFEQASSRLRRKKNTCQNKYINVLIWKTGSFGRMGEFFITAQKVYKYENYLLL